MIIKFDIKKFEVEVETYGYFICQLDFNLKGINIYINIYNNIMINEISQKKKKY